MLFHKFRKLVLQTTVRKYAPGAYWGFCLGRGLQFLSFEGGLNTILWGKKNLKTIDFTDPGGGDWVTHATPPPLIRGKLTVYAHITY